MLASTNKGNGWIRRLPSWQSLTAACTALLGRPPPTSQQPRYRRFLLRRDDSTSIRSSCVLQAGETSPNFTIHKFPFRPPPTRSARRLQITVLATRRLLWRLSQPPILFLATAIRSLQLQVRNSAMCRTPWMHRPRICCKAMMRRKLYQTGLMTRLH